MKRRLLNVLTALSLLLCAAVTTLWVRSYFVQDRFQYQHTDGPRRRWTSHTFASNRGSLYVSWPFIVFAADGAAEVYSRRHPDPEGYSYKRLAPDRDGDAPWNGLGFAAWPSDRNTTPESQMDFPRVFFPHWSVVLLTAILPATRTASAIRRRSRTKGNLCPSCGYDLRATPDRCPECGAAPATTPAPN
jgi:hypothetical protein